MKNPVIFTDRKVVMQSLQDALVNGHTRYVFGSTAIQKIEKAIAVFDMNYRALADRNERAKRKKRGLGNVHLVLWHKKEEVLWWLLATPKAHGSHPIHDAEKLRDAFANHSRLEIDGFELVRLPKTGTAQTKVTWRMTDAKYQAWRNYIIETVRGRSHNSMHHMLYQLWSMPGFGGIRSQVGKLATLYKGEVKRASIQDAPMPPRRLFYLRRLPHVGLSVKQLLSKVSAKNLAQHQAEELAAQLTDEATSTVMLLSSKTNSTNRPNVREHGTSSE